MPTKLTNEVLLFIQGELARFDRDGNDSAAQPTWETVRVVLADRERLLNLVRYCRHELFGLRARIAALEEELKAAQEIIDGAMDDIRTCGEMTCDECNLRTQALRAELKAAQEERDRLFELRVEANDQMAVERQADINNFRAQLIEAVRGMSMIYDRTSRESVIQLIQTFEPEK